MDSDQRNKDVTHSSTVRSDEIYRIYHHSISATTRKISGNIFRYISKNMQRYTVYLFLETALHVSGGISTHHQEHTQLYRKHLALAKL